MVIKELPEAGPYLFNADFVLEITLSEDGVDLSTAACDVSIADRYGNYLLTDQGATSDEAETPTFTLSLTSGSGSTLKTPGRYRVRYAVTLPGSQHDYYEQWLTLFPSSLDPPQTVAHSGALTRRQMRERIRHNLSKRTAYDESVMNPIGDPASTHPWPSNDLLNEKLDEAVRYLNRKCNLGHVQDLEVSVSSTTEDGPQQVRLQAQTPEVYGIGGQSGDVHQVKRAYLTISGTNYPLTAIDRAQYDRNGRGWESMDAGTPRYYWTEGNDLYLLPGTDTDATLHLMAGTGVIGFTGDGDTLLQLPNDYHAVPVDIATRMVAETQQQDAEMQAYAVLFGRRGEEGIDDIIRWKRQQTAQTQGSLHVRTTRFRVGRRN